jgi:hypothetical protein
MTLLAIGAKGSLALAGEHRFGAMSMRLVDH